MSGECETCGECPMDCRCDVPNASMFSPDAGDTAREEFFCARPGCEITTSCGVLLNGNFGAFPAMKPGEKMHLECYVQHCFDKYIKEKEF